jgi:hypothetical protein
MKVAALALTEQHQLLSVFGGWTNVPMVKVNHRRNYSGGMPLEK